MQQNQTEYAALAGQAITALKEFFDGGSQDEDVLARARVAQAVLSGWTRFEQVSGARSALNWMMARELAENADQLREYVRVTMPEAPANRLLVKELPIAR